MLGVSSLLAPPSAAAAPAHPERVLAALALYAFATVLSVTVGRTVAMPVWLAGFNIGVSLSMTLLVASSLDPHVKQTSATIVDDRILRC